MLKVDVKELLLSKLKPLVWYDGLHNDSKSYSSICVTKTFTTWGEIKILYHKGGSEFWSYIIYNAEYSAEYEGDLFYNALTIEEAKLRCENRYKKWVLYLFDLGEE